MAVLIGRYRSTLASSAAASDLTIEVASTAGLPTLGQGDHYYLSLVNRTANLIEVVRVTARSGSTLTVERGQSGTVAALWPVGTPIALSDDPQTLMEYIAEAGGNTAPFAEEGASWGDLDELGISDVDDGARVVMQKEGETDVKHMTFGQLSAKVSEGLSAPDSGQTAQQVGSAIRAYGQPFTTADQTKLNGIESGAKDDQDAADVPTSTAAFGNRLSSSDNTVQKALDTLDDVPLPKAHAQTGGGKTPAYDIEFPDVAPDGTRAIKDIVGEFRTPATATATFQGGSQSQERIWSAEFTIEGESILFEYRPVTAVGGTGTNPGVYVLEGPDDFLTNLISGRGSIARIFLGVGADNPFGTDVSDGGTTPFDDPRRREIRSSMPNPSDPTGLAAPADQTTSPTISLSLDFEFADGSNFYDGQLQPRTRDAGVVFSATNAAELHALVQAGGGGLDQDAVDARIEAEVKDFAETGKRKVAATDMQIKPEEVVNAFEGDAWSPTGGVTVIRATAYTASDIVSQSFQESRTQGPHLTNQYVGIRIPIAAKDNLENLRVYIGENDGEDYHTLYPGTGWTHLIDSPGNAYYVQEITDHPAGDWFGVQAFTPLRLDDASAAASVDAALTAGAGLDKASDDTSVTLSVADEGIATAKLADASVTTAKLAANAVATSQIGDDQITQAKMAPNSVGASELADNAVDAFAVQNGAITNSKLAPSAVTTSKMATEATQRLVPSGGTTGQVLKKTSNNDYAFGWGTDETGTGGGGGQTAQQVRDAIAAYGNAFTAADEAKLDGIETGATADQTGDDIRNALENLSGASKLPGTAIEDASLGTEQLVDDAVTQAKIGPGAVGTTELAANAVTTAKIASQTILGSRMGSNSVGSRVIADGAVTAGKIGNLAVVEGKIGDGAVTSAKIGNGAVTEGKLGALAVTAAKISGGAVTLAKAAADLVARLVPTGGSANQVLTRTGAAGFGWADAAAGGANEHLETLLTNQTVTLAITDPAANRAAVPTWVPTGTFQLDAQRGTFLLTANLRFEASTITNFGFTSGTPGDATVRLVARFLADELRAAPAFQTAGRQGLSVNAELYSGSTKIGDAPLTLTRDGLTNQRVGVYLPFDTASSSATGGVTVHADVTLNFDENGIGAQILTPAHYESTLQPSLANTDLALDASVDLILGDFQAGSENSSQGLTRSGPAGATNTRIVAAREGVYSIGVGLNITVHDPNTGGDHPLPTGRRSYVDVRLFKAASASASGTTELLDTRQTTYFRRYDNSADTSNQSPNAISETVHWAGKLEAGEAVGIQVVGKHFQDTSATYQVRVEASSSLMRIANSEYALS